jgi:hypothetical protein
MSLYVSRAWPRPNVHIVHEPVGQPLGAATRADVTIAMGIGQLHIGALAQSSDLIAGQIGFPDSNHVTRAFAIDGDTATFTLREQDSQANSLVKFNDGSAIWDLRLNPATPMRLTLTAGVGESTIDLTQLHVTEFSLTAGVGSTTLTLPRQGHVRAQVSGGVNETIIHVPAGVAMRVENSADFGTISLPNDYRRQGKVSVSPGYETATNRVDLKVSSGIGEIVIAQDGQ